MSEENQLDEQLWVVSQEEMQKFIITAMAGVNVEENQAIQLADLLIEADLRGHHSHGLNRLSVYLENIKVKENKNGKPWVLKQKGCTALVGGDNAMGVITANFCTDLAIKLARDHGIGWVVAAHSNHYGICAHFANKIAKQGFVGISFTNTSPNFFPFGAAEKGLGCNPLCVSALSESSLSSGDQKDGFCLDMATSTVAMGKVEVADRKGVSKISKAWGADSNGLSTTNPKSILNGGGLLPLGTADEASAAYKGTGLSMMVDLFTGILAGKAWGKHVGKWRDLSTQANVSHCFVALDPACFAPGFAGRLQSFLDQTRGLQPVNPEQPVLVPGDPEEAHSGMCAKAGGIVYPTHIIEHLKTVAHNYKIPMFVFKEVNK